MPVPARHLPTGTIGVDTPISLQAVAAEARPGRDGL
jgi:hypothetical protein